MEVYIIDCQLKWTLKIFINVMYWWTLWLLLMVIILAKFKYWSRKLMSISLKSCQLSCTFEGLQTNPFWYNACFLKENLFHFLEWNLTLLFTFKSIVFWIFFQFGAKICLVTSFRDTCYIEILPKDQSPSRGT